MKGVERRRRIAWCGCQGGRARALKIAPMPHLPRSITDAAIFLYPTEEDAAKRVGWGGSGFLVGIPLEADPTQAHLYAVSNDHVTQRASVIRVEKMNGNVEIIAGDPSDWIEHPDGDDIAVRPLGTAPVLIQQIRDQRIPVDGYCFFDADRLISPDDFGWGAGPSIGDECLMVGRYINHDDQQFDRGVVRFGNLAMFPESIRQHGRAFDQEGFLVDMRSVSGFSGSGPHLLRTAGDAVDHDRGATPVADAAQRVLGTRHQLGSSPGPPEDAGERSGHSCLARQQHVVRRPRVEGDRAIERRAGRRETETTSRSTVGPAVDRRCQARCRRAFGCRTRRSSEGRHQRRPVARVQRQT